MEAYGKELIIDIKDCSIPVFTREIITIFMKELCDLLSMTRADLHFWDYEDDEEARANAAPHLAGISAVQFITTSNITIHTLDKLNAIYLNIFTCGDLDKNKVEDFCKHFWDGNIINSTLLVRA